MFAIIIMTKSNMFNLTPLSWNELYLVFDTFGRKHKYNCKEILSRQGRLEFAHYNEFVRI